MANQHTGHTQPSIDLEEHRSISGVNTKAVTLYGFTGNAVIPVKVTDNGDGTGTLAGSGSGGSSSLKPTTYDTKTLTQTSTADAWAYTLSGVLKATKTINYSDSSKSTITSIVWS